MQTLRNQLGFDWTKIVGTGGATLGETYQRLTGKSGSEGFQDFVARVATLDQGGQLALPTSSNPFPIQGTGDPAPSPQPGGSAGQPDPGMPAPGAPDPGTPDIPLPVDAGGVGVMLGTIVVIVAIIAVIVLILNATGTIHILG